MPIYFPLQINGNSFIQSMLHGSCTYLYLYLLLQIPICIFFFYLIGNVNHSLLW